MGNRKLYDWSLTLAYAGMLLLFVYLNFSPNHKESFTTIAVNIVMFAIVAAIFVWADFGCFARTNAIIRDLRKATSKIHNDALNTRSYLYEPYQSGNVVLFDNSRTKGLYQDFLFELNREHDPRSVYYRPKVDDYFNDDLIDHVIHKNEMNQVAGMLTGLGILGTFIGLSLGLQNFNTGTTAEMTNSIEPLMNGIKVAFHTSIYGMVFSLVFNLVYRRKLYEAESAVDSFCNAFRKFVLPDTANDGMNQILALQDEQLSAIKHMSESIADSIADAITPHLADLRSVIIDFENMATRSQVEGISRIVEYFVEEMNKSLSGSFAKLNSSVEEMYASQKQNSQSIAESLNTMLANTGNLRDVNRETEKLYIALNKYSESVQEVQKGLRETIISLNEHNKTSSDFLKQELGTLNAQADIIENLEKTVGELHDAISHLVKSNDESDASLSDSLMQISDSLYSIRRTLERDKQPGTKR